MDFPVGEWHQVKLTRSNNFLSASVGGQLLANQSVPKNGPASDQRNFTLKVLLSHYYVASIDDFMVNQA
jgi:hypothetical protein